MIFNIKENQSSTLYTNKDNALMRKMVISYSMFLLAILILFYGLYLSIFNNMRNSYFSQNKSTLISNVKLFEKDLDIMEVYCRQLLQNNQFRKIMNYTEDISYDFASTGNDIKTMLATDVYPETLLPVNEVYCYLPNTGYILSPNYFINQNWFYNWIKKYEPLEYDNWLKALTDKDMHYRFLPMNALSPTSTKDFFMYSINLNDLYYLNADAMVCFVIDRDELALLFEVMQNKDQEGFLMVANQNEELLLSMSQQGIPDSNALLSLNFSNDFSTFRVEGQNVTVGKYVSSSTEYQYYYSFPDFNSLPNVILARTAFLVLCGITLLAGGVLVTRFSRRNVLPIVELGQKLSETVEAQNHLQEVVDSQRPIICNSYIKQLMSGTITSEEEASYIKDFLELSGEDLIYNVLYAVVYNSSPDSQPFPSPEVASLENINSIVMDTLLEYCGPHLYCYSPSDRTYALLMSCDSAEESTFIMKMQDMVLRLHEYLLDTYGVWFFAGVGKNTDSLMHVWESYQQSKEAINYTTKSYIFFPYEIIMKNSNVFYYPPEISTKLIHFITTGNSTQVQELFSLIHQENIEERSLPINLLKFLLSDIRNTLLKARFTLPSNVDPDAAALLDMQFNEHLSFGLCEDLALTLCQLFSSGTEENNLASTLEKYIAENYKDPSLGLNKISDEFRISESYFSHMFKEKTGVNFSTYLENIRMGEAARLIKETNTGLNELYIAVGYNNPNTFRRAFKKTYGITPSSMRDSSPMV